VRGRVVSPAVAVEAAPRRDDVMKLADAAARKRERQQQRRSGRRAVVMPARALRPSLVDVDRSEITRPGGSAPHDSRQAAYQLRAGARRCECGVNLASHLASDVTNALNRQCSERDEPDFIPTGRTSRRTSCGPRQTASRSVGGGARMPLAVASRRAECSGRSTGIDRRRSLVRNRGTGFGIGLARSGKLRAISDILVLVWY
jgi:hypothetical protein